LPTFALPPLTWRAFLCRRYAAGYGTETESGLLITRLRRNLPIFQRTKPFIGPHWEGIFEARIALWDRVSGTGSAIHRPFPASSLQFSSETFAEGSLLSYPFPVRVELCGARSNAIPVVESSAAQKPRDRGGRVNCPTRSETGFEWPPAPVQLPVCSACTLLITSGQPFGKSTRSLFT